MCFPPDAVEIQDVKAGMGDGLLTVGGRAKLNNGQPEKFDFKLSANQVPVDIPDTMEMTLKQPAYLGRFHEKVGADRWDRYF